MEIKKQESLLEEKNIIIRSRKTNVSKVLYAIVGFFLLAFIPYAYSNSGESNQTDSTLETNDLQRSNDIYGDAVITVSFENGKLILRDNQGNPFDPNNPEEFLTYVESGRTVTWQKGNGLQSISIQIDSGQHIFEKLPHADANGNWSGDLANLNSGDAKYSIIYTPNNSGSTYILDPKLRMKK